MATLRFQDPAAHLLAGGLLVFLPTLFAFFPNSLPNYSAVEEYLAVLDDAAFGAATEVTPKFISPADPAARWTGAHGGQAFFAYAPNYLIDTDHAIIVDVEGTTAIRRAAGPGAQ